MAHVFRRPFDYGIHARPRWIPFSSPTVGGDASVSLPGANGSAEVGLLGLSGTADKSLEGVAANGSVGTVSTAVLLALIGNAISGTAGSPNLSGDSAKTLSGLAMTGAAGTPSLSGNGALSLSGNASNGTGGTPSISGGATQSLSGVSVATAAGILRCSARPTSRCQEFLSPVKSATFPPARAGMCPFLCPAMPQAAR